MWTTKKIMKGLLILTYTTIAGSVSNMGVAYGSHASMAEYENMIYVSSSSFDIGFDKHALSVITVVGPIWGITFIMYFMAYRRLRAVRA